MTAVIPAACVDGYRRHLLHDMERDWPETNCYVDLWIEVLAARGQDPLAMLGFTALLDFEGDQFTFFKPPPADLARLYGVEIVELAIFDDLVGHLDEQVGRGRLPLVEVDSYYLPDAKGASYRSEHTKTTIAINRIDAAARAIAYFHNGGYFALSGDDFDGLFGRLPQQAARPDALFPYVEMVKFHDRPSDAALAATARALLVGHYRNRPRGNPLAAFAARFPEHSARLGARPVDYFHKYAFNTLRQLGANFELMASHLDWLGNLQGLALADAAVEARSISATAKVMQFQLARAVMRKSFAGLESQIDRMVEAYDRLFAALGVALADPRVRVHA